MQFARLFDFKTNQLLVSITINEERTGYLLSIVTYHQGAFIQSGLPFPSLEEAQRALDGFTEKSANDLYCTIITAVCEPPRPTISGILEGFENWINNSKN